jgi:hypothetical protein
VAFLLPFLVARAVERPTAGREAHPLDGLEHRRLTGGDRAELDLALGLAEVPR